MIIVGHHRSIALARRHRAQLRRDYAPRSVEIISRRNKRGRFSVRGRYFVFEVGENQEPKTLELVVHFDYENPREGSRLLRFQVHVIVPFGREDSKYVSEIKHYFEEGGKLAKGYKVKVIYWGKVRRDEGDKEVSRTDFINKELRQLAILGGTSKIIRRKTTTRKNRKPRKGTAKK